MFSPLAEHDTRWIGPATTRKVSIPRTATPVRYACALYSPALHREKLTLYDPSLRSLTRMLSPLQSTTSSSSSEPGSGGSVVGITVGYGLSSPLSRRLPYASRATTMKRPDSPAVSCFGGEGDGADAMCR